MVCSGDTYHMGTSQLFCEEDQIERDLLDKHQPSELTYNLHPPKSSQTMIKIPRFPFLVILQVLIEVFTNDNPHCFVFKSPIRITEQFIFNGVKI